VEIKFPTDTTVKAWLYITTRNSCFNYIKRINKVSLQEIEPNSVYSDETILVAIIRTEILQEIITLIDTLPIECRRIFKLSCFDGLTNNEIATKLCLSIHTVKNQKARAVYLIRKRRRRLHSLPK
jgi:RNA polymerase sigma-70 factor (ECF subfamily)